MAVKQFTWLFCITCKIMRIETAKDCKTFIYTKEAAEDVYSDNIIQIIKYLIERFKDCKAVVENLKSKFPNKRKLDVDKVKQARKTIDEYLDELKANAIAAIDGNLKEKMNTIKEQINVYDSFFFILSTSTLNIDRIMRAGNKIEKIIAINRATEQTKQYCNMLLEMYREMSEISE